MQDEEEPIKDKEFKEEEWSEPDDDSLLSEEDVEPDIEKMEEDLDEFPEFTDDEVFPSFQRGKNIAKALDATQLYLG